VVIIIMDEKIRASELMLIIWQLYPLKKVSMKHFRL
jgi:hypothetical protein